MKLLESCTYFNEARCGSCNQIQWGIGESAANKQAATLKVLQDHIHATRTSVLPIYTGKVAFGTRAKAKLIVGGSVSSPVLGIVDARGNISELEKCPLHVPLLNYLIGEIKKLITKHSLVPYRIKKQSGELKAVLLSCNQAQTECCVRFVLRSKQLLPDLESVALDLERSIPQVKVITANIQPIPHAVLEGPEEIQLSKGDYWWEKYGDKSIAFSSNSFFQVTPHVAESLYSTAAQWLKMHHANNVLELYCGAGAFSLACASEVSSSIGFEKNQSSIAAAQISVKENNLLNCTFQVADLEVAFPVLPISPDAVIVNPPRRGLSQRTIDFLNNQKPDVVIYSSCNPNTLATDLVALGKSYEVTMVKCFDMFPLTDHVETLVCLRH